MKLNTQSPLVLLCLFFTLATLFSCSKDSDLLTDYVSLDPDVLVGTYVRSDAFQISIINNSEDETFEITVNSENADTENSGSGGTIVNDTYQTSSSAGIVLDVLANDTFKNTENVSISETSQPIHGSVLINSDNTLTYTPYTVQPTEDQFTYTAEFFNEDGSTGTETGNVSVSIISPTDRNYGELKAFPTAFGAGSSATGGRGGAVYHVTNLNNSGPGSFRDAMSASNRTVVFDVSGTIELTSSLSITSDNWTVAGQTAPDGGISITGSNVYFQNVNNAILRYIRFRPDYNSSGNVDAVNITSCSNMIIDHCSVSWGGDEAMSVIGDSDNFTIQRTIFAESATGCLLGDSNSEISDNLSLHTSLFYNISHRHPNVNAASRSDVINNISHNWYTRIIVVGTSRNTQLNEINNYRQRGSRSTNLLDAHEGNWLDIGGGSQRDGMRIYTSGNIINDVLLANEDAWTKKLYLHRFDINSGAYSGMKQWDTAHPDFKSTTPFSLLGHPIPVQTASEAFTDVSTDVGACKTLDGNGIVTTKWDVLDERYLNYVKTNTYDSYEYPPTAITSKSHYISYMNSISASPINSRDAGYDTDEDGIPNAWEILKGFDPNKQDNNEDLDGNGYTNLEEFINLVDF